MHAHTQANQMLCPSKHASVHIHGCNQYHANSSARRAASEDGGSDTAATPLLPAAAGAVLVDLVHQPSHGDEQEQGDEEGEGMQHVGRRWGPASCDGILGGGAHTDAPASDEDEHKLVQANGMCHLQPRHVLKADGHSYPSKLAPGMHHHAHSHSHPTHVEHQHLHDALRHKQRGHAHALRGGHEAAGWLCLVSPLVWVHQITTQPSILDDWALQPPSSAWWPIHTEEGAQAASQDRLAGMHACVHLYMAWWNVQACLCSDEHHSMRDHKLKFVVYGDGIHAGVGLCLPQPVHWAVLGGYDRRQAAENSCCGRCLVSSKAQQSAHSVAFYLAGAGFDSCAGSAPAAGGSGAGQRGCSCRFWQIQRCGR
eukprot:8066-Pelagomonas_calceolata.AAC.4